MVLLQRSDTTSTTAIGGSEEQLLAREDHPDIVRQLSAKGLYINKTIYFI
jgi:hypothetical protein